MEKKTLLETYSKRIAVAQDVYSRTFDGAELDNKRKMALAMVLDNQNKFMNEAFSNSVGTQRADLGDYKRFCLNLTTVALPTLIAHDLVIVSPMSSYSGYITYIQYTAGTNKGATAQGKVLNDVFHLGDVDADYTGSAVVETVTLGSGESSKEVTLAWTPVIADTFGEGKTVKFINEAGDISFPTVTDGKVTVTENGRLAYAYDNVVIPQNDIPMVNVSIVPKALVAKARRVAVYYSQIAAFQAKQDYGFDLGDQIAEKACGELAYEIDTEIVNTLVEHAADGGDTCTWNKTLPNGVSKADHYEGFAEVVDAASTIIYNQTKRYAATYMLCARDILNILMFIKGWKAASTSKINGPYFAGTLNGLKVFVSPSIASHKFILGVNGDDMMSSAAVYAPYMAVVPTQLLGYADGGMSQGFSTMYALEMLNPNLLIAGKVVEEDQVVNTKVVA